MKNVNSEMQNLTRLVKMMAAQFGVNTEVILHDLKKPYDKSIVAIENNWITGRNVGDGGTNLGLEVLRNPPTADGDLFNYFTKTNDGKLLRSSTLYFRDEKGEVIGSLCVNTDITNYVQVQETLGQLSQFTQEHPVEEVFANNVNDLFDYFIEKSKMIVDKKSEDMTKEDKIEIIRYLDGKGFFLITRAGDIACDYLNISKYSLYKYLRIARGEHEDGQQNNDDDKD